MSLRQQISELYIEWFRDGRRVGSRKHLEGVDFDELTDKLLALFEQTMNEVLDVEPKDTYNASENYWKGQHHLYQLQRQRLAKLLKGE